MVVLFLLLDMALHEYDALQALIRDVD